MKKHIRIDSLPSAAQSRILADRHRAHLIRNGIPVSFRYSPIFGAHPRSSILAENALAPLFFFMICKGFAKDLQRI